MESRKFAKILRRYRLGEATEAERALVEQWYDLLEEGHEALSESDDAELEARIWDRITSGIQSADTKDTIPQRVFMRRYWKVFSSLAAAAVIGLVVWLGGLIPAATDKDTMVQTVVPTGNFKKISNDTQITKVIELEDGTVVKLAPGSSLNVPAKFQDTRREVYLTGEAFFEVAKNPTRPFFVYSGQVTTRVLGTSFTIKPLGDGSQIEVSVKTGRVEVYRNQSSEKEVAGSTESKGVVLTPNQRAVYYSSTGVFQAAVVMQPVPLAAEDQTIEVPLEFRFEETALREVLKALEKSYGIEIMLENESLNECPFTGDLSKQDLFQKLDIINLVLGTTYEVKGTRILIKGNGCE